MTDEIVIHLGKVPSLNKFYSSTHWTYRSKEKTKWKAIVLDQLGTYDPIHFTTYEVILYTNYRYDIDNCIMASKFTLDAVKEWSGIDDSPKYFKKLTIKQDTTLPKDTSKIVIRNFLV